mmetsp:Transcript_64251/g.139617  ORF Transcript_64251/g.139617 Transcript_64251/m.139617 type:complete len:221 (+) Transcript_64251:1267-1929(+)
MGILHQPHKGPRGAPLGFDVGIIVVFELLQQLLCFSVAREAQHVEPFGHTGRHMRGILLQLSQGESGDDEALSQQRKSLPPGAADNLVTIRFRPSFLRVQEVHHQTPGWGPLHQLFEHDMEVDKEVLACQIQAVLFDLQCFSHRFLVGKAKHRRGLIHRAGLFEDFIDGQSPRWTCSKSRKARHTSAGAGGRLLGRRNFEDGWAAAEGQSAECEPERRQR